VTLPGPGAFNTFGANPCAILLCDLSPAKFPFSESYRQEIVRK
jgi:hypothetical protein